MFQSKWKLWIHFFTEILSCGQISENTKTNQSTGHVPVPLFPLQLHQSECYKWQKQRTWRRSRRKENKSNIMKQMNKEDFFKSLMKMSPIISPSVGGVDPPRSRCSSPCSTSVWFLVDGSSCQPFSDEDLRLKLLWINTDLTHIHHLHTRINTVFTPLTFKTHPQCWFSSPGPVTFPVGSNPRHDCAWRHQWAVLQSTSLKEEIQI